MLECKDHRYWISIHHDLGNIVLNLCLNTLEATATAAPSTSTPKPSLGLLPLKAEQ